MMERAESGKKLYTRMRLWEFPDQYVVEPTDGSSGSSLAINRADGAMNLIDGVPECSSLRVPKIRSIFGVVGMLKLVAGKYMCNVFRNSLFLFKEPSILFGFRISKLYF